MCDYIDIVFAFIAVCLATSIATLVFMGIVPLIHDLNKKLGE